MWVSLLGYCEHTRGNCLGIPVMIIRQKGQLLFAVTVRIMWVCQDFWGILWATEIISGKYCVVEMSGKMRSAAGLLSSAGILRSVKS